MVKSQQWESSDVLITSFTAGNALVAFSVADHEDITVFSVDNHPLWHSLTNDVRHVERDAIQSLLDHAVSML